MNTMIHKDVFIRLSDPSGKTKDVINQHRVWDVDRFFASQQEQHNGPKVKPNDRRVVSLATKADYNEHRKATRT